MSKRSRTCARLGLWIACVVVSGALEAQDAQVASSDTASGSSHADSVAGLGNAWSDPENPIRKLFQGERLDLWSLQPLQKPSIPSVENADWGANPIDCFLLESWRASGCEPSPGLEREELAQRVSLDLTGLRASMAEVDTLSKDLSPDAYERFVDRLLASPAYGEHWARQWLDVVRYSDSNGFDWDEYRKQAWRYRDFVVRAWNQDLPFDQFVTRQLAGDELINGPPNDFDEQDCLIATGYLRMGPFDSAAKLFDEQDRARAEVLTDLTETTANAFLGLTLSCCRCHDHKTDPLSQTDHYRFRAFFAATRFAEDLSIDTLQTQQDTANHNQQIEAQIEELQRKIDAHLDKAKSIEQVAAPKLADGDANEKNNDEKESDKPTEAELIAKLPENEQMEFHEWRSAMDSLRTQLRSPTIGLVMTDEPKSIDAIHVLYQGDHRAPREQVEPGFPSVLFPNPPKIEIPAENRSTGRRLALAKWIRGPENPWTARVLVNRIWQQHFGVGLVATPNDFGVSGSPPTHPALLDYLASELVAANWSVKAIQRLIVTSQAYQQRPLPNGLANAASAHQASARASLKRLSAEQFRDTILQVSGLLQHRAGGAPVWPSLSDDILQANPAVLDDNETKTKGWYPSPPSEQSVRSLYLVQKRTLRLPWLETFDLPENTVSCPKREMSIVASQALTLLNGELASQAALELAQRLSGDDKSTDDKEPAVIQQDFHYIEQLFEKVLSRRPSPTELQQCAKFLVHRTRSELALVLLNTNELAFVP